MLLKKPLFLDIRKSESTLDTYISHFWMLGRGFGSFFN